jgi:hypothetical protein
VQLLLSIFIGWIILLSRVAGEYRGLAAKSNLVGTSIFLRDQRERHPKVNTRYEVAGRRAGGLCGGLFEIGADEVDEFFAEVGREGDAAVLEQVQADVVLEDLGHDAVDAAADGGEKHEDVGAVLVLGEGALDGVHLATDAFDAVQ